MYTNQVFNSTCKAIKHLRNEKNNGAIWEFECLVKGPGCKGTFEARIAHVKRGVKKSCGCHKREDVSDKIFYDSAGEPTCKAIEYMGPSSDGKSLWKFECLVKGPSCLEIFTARSCDVKKGGTCSCGCFRISNITGKIFYDSDGNSTCQALWCVNWDEQKNHKKWLFRCLVNGPGCKETFVADAASVKTGNTRSCGCCKSKANTTHGMSKSAEYQTWINVHNRCYDPENKDYPNYGGRGIKVCWRWHKDNPNGFINFYNDIGYKLKPGDSIERLDNNLGYSPDNCDVIPKGMQARNRRCNKIQSKEEAEFIRDLYHNKKVSTKNLAEFFRCSTSTIRNIINNKRWT